MANVDWSFDACQVVTCNCDWGCPCQFNALPTKGNCRAATVYRIETGRFGDTRLDGVTFLGMLAWPGAIHEGGGEAQLVIDENTTEDQRKAVTAIFKGEETEPGGTIFNVFSNVIDCYYEPIIAPVSFEVDVDERTCRFSVPGIVEGTGEPIRNPVTGQPHRVRITVPEGFEYHDAEFGSSIVRTHQARIPLDWSNGHGQFARVSWARQGVVHP